MTSITLNPRNSNHAPHNVSAALGELALASRNLITALWVTLLQRNIPPAPTLCDEANELRTMADQVALHDPRFAQDLYAAADRHELSFNAD